MGYLKDVKRIRELENVAKQLEPDATQRSSLGGAAFAYSENSLESLSEAPSYRITEDNGLDLYRHSITDETRSIDEVLEILSENERQL